MSAKLSNVELAAFCSQFAILLKGGITPVESLRILLSDTEDSASKALLQQLIDSVMEGNRLALAMEESKAFPKYVVTTVKLGEEAGSTDEVFTSLGEFYEREAAIRENIASALTYPLVMIFMMIVVILVLITKVLPIFNRVFIQLGTEMTGFAASLLNFGDSMTKYGLISLVLLIALLVFYIIVTRTETGKKFGERLFSSMPLTKKLYEEIAIGRFAGGLALARSAGLDTFVGIDLVSELVENKKTLEKIKIVRNGLSEGDNLAEALKRANMFSNVNNRLISVGIKTGDDDVVLKRIAEEYSKKSEKRMNLLISIIEPSLVIVLSIVVGLILLSVILPLMGIMANIG